MDYVEKVLQNFNASEAKLVNTNLASYFKLSNNQSPKAEAEQEHMKRTLHASEVGSIMYIMICSRPNIAHAM